MGRLERDLKTVVRGYQDYRILVHLMIGNLRNYVEALYWSHPAAEPLRCGLNLAAFDDQVAAICADVYTGIRNWRVKMDERQKKEAPVLGVLRLDYNYPPALGDIDHPDTFDFDVIYRAVPGLTFEICQSGKIPEEVWEHCKKAVEFLNEKGVSGITGDCGFMLNIQDFVRNHTDKPVFMSCLGQLHSMIHSINSDAEIAIFTANSKSLEAVESELDRLSGLREHSHRLQIVGCEKVPGFEAVAQGRMVDCEKVQPGVIELAREFLRNHPKVECILLECTELPPYADALRYETGLPVYDSVTNCNAFMSGYFDNRNFGMGDWQKPWVGPHKAYHLGENLSDPEKDDLINIDRD